MVEFLKNNFDFSKIDWAKIILPFVVIFVAIVVYALIKKLTKRIFQRSARFGNQRRQRVDTVRTLVVNIEKYLVIIIALILILSIFGINVTSMVAGLGIMTAIIGLAFQDLAKDIIAGVSIVTENQFDVGDNVEINGFRGSVISLGLKTTKIKNYKGHIKSISNRDITEVTNYTDNKDALAEVTVGVSYKHKSEEVEKAFDKVRLNLRISDKMEDSLGDLIINGITDFADSAVQWRVSMPCKPNTSISVERSIRREIKEVFDKEGIEIPYPQLVLAERKKN